MPEAAEIARKLQHFDVKDLKPQHLHVLPNEFTSSPLDDDFADGDFTTAMVQGVVLRAADIQRLSKRWSRRWWVEEGGKKLEIQDCEEVLKALRKL